MGCWGITAFESDAGLDAAHFIRKHLPENGRVQLKTILDALQQDSWNRPPDASERASHSSPMVLAEIIVKFLDGNLQGLDYDEGWAKNDKKFKDLVSFQADRSSIQWIRDYLNDTLKYAVEEVDSHKGTCTLWNGWFLEKDWLAWQVHMRTLISRLEGLLLSGEEMVELVKPQEPEFKMQSQL